MNKLIISAMCLALAGYAFAQESAPAPEATSQEQCEIEEKDVDTMMDEYISSKGWVEGLNEKNGKRFYVVKGTGVIQAPRESQQYIGSRVAAYNKAMLAAKEEMARHLGLEIKTETLRDYAEGSAVNLPPPTEGQEVANKLKKFLYAKLNKVLASEGIDPVKDPQAAKKELGKQLNSEVYEKLISTSAKAKILGMQACCTFEGSPASEKGQIGVVAIWSDKLQQMATSIVTGVPVPSVGAKRPISDQVSKDPKVLMSTFGVQQKINENGELVLIGFGQAGGVSETTMSINAAKNKAKDNAIAAIREFAGEQVAVASDTLQAETSESFESGLEKYSNEGYRKERQKAVAEKMNIVGIAPLRNVKVKHPLNGKTVCVCVVTWSPKQARQAIIIRETIDNPTASSPSAPSVPPSDSNPFKNHGDEADPDAI